MENSNSKSFEWIKSLYPVTPAVIIKLVYQSTNYISIDNLFCSFYNSKIMKLHPHIKHFLKTIVLAELSTSTKKNWEQKFAEYVFMELMEHLESNPVQTTEELSKVVDEQINKIKTGYVEKVFETISNSAKQFPLDILNKKGNL